VIHRSLESIGREWFGLVVLQQYLGSLGTVQDVHRQSQDHDLIFTPPGGAPQTIDVKVDYYFGADDKSDFHRRRTGFAALETVSNDVLGTLGWMVTSATDYIMYYFLALDNPPDQLRAWSAAGDAEAALHGLQAYDDCLLVLPTRALQAWFWEDKRYLGWRHCRIPNVDGDGRVYHTWVRLTPVEALVRLPGVRLYDRLVAALHSRRLADP
jgi:hypothetical protein